jgi:hypothetical protein
MSLAMIQTAKGSTIPSQSNSVAYQLPNTAGNCLVAVGWVGSLGTIAMTVGAVGLIA